MLTGGRRRGGKVGTGLAPRSVRLTLGRLNAAFELACMDGHLAADPCRYVKLPSQPEREDTTWTEAELRRFLARAAGHRLAAVWLLSALGLRRGEVLGLKWSDIDLDAGTLTIASTRVLVNGKVIVKSPKSRRSWRVLPLFEPVTGALKALRDLEAIEASAAGSAYQDSGYVAVDELGQPVDPDYFSDEFARMCRYAVLPKIRLHDTRGTMNSILEQAGVPETLRAGWFGHTIAVNRKNYLRAPRPGELAPISDKIRDIFKADVSKM